MKDRIGSSRTDYGKGVVELDAIGAGEQAGALTRQIRGTFAAPSYEPPLLPVAALEVHQLAQQKDVKLEQILAVLEKDPLLAARVLKVANSPLYSGAPLHSLYNAVMRLGLKNLASIVWQVALNMRVFRSKHYQEPMETIRRHSTYVAHIARLVAKSTPIPLDYAFLCGLLHDVGAAAVLLMLGERVGKDDVPLSADVLASVLGEMHAEASQIIAKQWRLHDDLQFVLGSHHSVLIGNYPHPAAAVVAIAEETVRELSPQLSLRGPEWDRTSRTAIEAAKMALHLNDKALDRLRADAEPLLAQVAGDA